GQAEGQWQRKRTDSVPIPKGAVVAYKKKQLVIENKTCAILLYGNTKKKTFVGMIPKMIRRFAVSGKDIEFSPIRGSIEEPINEGWDIYHNIPIGRIKEPFHLDFKCLQAEVSKKTEELTMLSKDVQDVVFSSFLSMLSDRKILYDLMNMVELDQVGHMDGPGGMILDVLQQDSTPPWIDLKDLILYLLQALMVLSDTQLSLLAQSMEKRLLLQQRELDVVKKLQGKDLKPVKCLSNAMKFRQFEILQKTSQSLFWKSEDTPVGYSLLEILEPNCPVPELEVSAPICFKNTVPHNLKSNMDVNAIVEGSVSVEFGHSCGYDIEVQCTSIPDSKLESFQSRKLLDQEPSFLKDCRMRKKDLYVVTEAFEVTKDTVLEDSSSVDLSGKVVIPQVAKVQAQGQWRRERTDSISIPKGTVVAYKKKQLVIENNTCDFKCLQAEVSKKTEELTMLSKDVQDVVFSSFLSMLSDRKILYDLMNMVELDQVGHMDGPGGMILDVLQQDSTPPWIDLKDLILYLLQALMVLSDTQLSLLAQSMEKRLLLQQRELGTLETIGDGCCIQMHWRRADNPTMRMGYFKDGEKNICRHQSNEEDPSSRVWREKTRIQSCNNIL
ncbi:hypothetical protein STEG23_026876, partial [Scotinomys teguina]